MKRQTIASGFFSVPDLEVISAKTTARVLTSEDNLRLLKEKERQKNEKEALKLERQRRKQEKALLKLEGIILLKIW